MKVSDLLADLSQLGGAKWALHAEARRRAGLGEDIIELTIGEPDTPMAAEIAPAIAKALDNHRVGYAAGQGEPALLEVLAEIYSSKRGHAFAPQQFAIMGKF